MDEAEKGMDGILNHGPSADSVYILLQRMKREGRSRDVLRHCIRFLGVYPDHAGLRLMLAQSYLDMGFVGLAETELEKVASEIDALIPSYKILGAIYAREGRMDEARHMLSLYLAHNPEDPEAPGLLTEMEAGPGPSEASPALEKPAEAGDTAPDDEREDVLVDVASPTIAELYYEQGNLGAAVSAYEKVVNENPDDEKSIRRLAELKEMAAREGGEDLTALARKLVGILERWLPRLREMGNA